VRSCAAASLIRPVYFDPDYCADDPFEAERASELASLPIDMQRRIAAVEIACKYVTLRPRETPLADADELTREMWEVTEKIEVFLLKQERQYELGVMPYREYLQTPEWQAKRTEARERAGERCQVCNADDLLDVHHRTYERRGYERDGDLTVLCRTCHELFSHFGRLASKPRIPFAAP
jgi:hypothetical protein